MKKVRLNQASSHYNSRRILWSQLEFQFLKFNIELMIKNNFCFSVYND